MKQDPERLWTRRQFALATFFSALALALKGDTPDQVSNLPLPTLNPDADNYLVISDVHLGKKDRKKLAVTQAEVTLANLLNQLSRLSVAAFLGLGDMVEETHSPEKNAKYLQQYINIINLLTTEKINLLGNHDLQALKRAKISQMFSDNNLNPQFKGVRTDKHGQVVYLDLEMTNEGAKVPEDTLAWLPQVVFKDTPTVMMSHYPVHLINILGNFHFDQTPEKSVLANSADLLKIIAGLPVRAIISGHVHQFHVDSRREPIQVTLPSFSESVAQGSQMYNPGVYSTLEVTPDDIMIKSYSNGYVINSAVI
jgi:UDP-2,3-diacylglucosamine pyrophosphatase LpxH